MTVLILNGFIDRHTIELVDKTLKGLLEKNRSKIVVDCAELTYISSNGMGVFIQLREQGPRAGRRHTLCSMRDIAKTVITMLGLHRLFEVFEQRDAAVESFKRK